VASKRRHANVISSDVLAPISLTSFETDREQNGLFDLVCASSQSDAVLDLSIQELRTVVHLEIDTTEERINVSFTVTSLCATGI